MPDDTGFENQQQGHSLSAKALHAMAWVRWILLGLVTIVAAGSVWTFWGPKTQGSTLASEQVRFYCPMHPQIRSPDPGDCPICHMRLEPIPPERQDGAGPAHSGTETPREAPSHVAPVTLTPEKQQAAGIAMTVAEKGALASRLRVPVVIAARQGALAQVRVRAPGFVEQVLVREIGVMVSRGQALALVYSPDLYRAQKEFIAASKWTGPGAPPTDLLAAARTSLELLGLPREDIDRLAKTGQSERATPVRAPVSGVITQLSAVLGSRADPEMVLYEIADLSTVWAIASLSSGDAASVKHGTTARLYLRGEDSPIESAVELVEPTIDENSRSLRVRIPIQNRDHKLRPGQWGDAEFDLEPTAGVFIPSDAVVRTGVKSYLFVALENGRFEPRTVITGAVVNEKVQILSGLTEGERVVARGTFMLDSESRLQASFAGAPAPSEAPNHSPEPSR